MLLFEKSDLRYAYSWTAGRKAENLRIYGFSPHHFLYRGEGYEVLPFLKKYMNSRGLCSLESFQQIEAMIRNNLCASIASHQDIKRWLDQNYHK